MKVHLKNLQKLKKIDRSGLNRKIKEVCLCLSCDDREMEIVLCDNTMITRLNKEFFAIDRPTDVISFCLEDEISRGIWGEIIVSVEAALNYSEAHHCLWEEEMLRYIIHGILHLMGYDDHTPAEKRKMRRKENQLLQKIG